MAKSGDITSLLQGEVVEDPKSDDINVEKMLIGFLRALLQEQNGDKDSA
jgi:hypothetical protein